MPQRRSPKPSPQTKDHPPTFCNVFFLVSFFLVFMVASSFALGPEIADVVVQATKVVSYPMTGCGWNDKLTSIHEEYPQYGLDAFVASEYAPVCILEEPLEVTDFDSAVQKAMQVIGTVSHDIQVAISKLKREADDMLAGKLAINVVPDGMCADDDGLIKPSEILFSLAEFWVVNQKEFLLLPWSEKSWEDIVLREPLG